MAICDGNCFECVFPDCKADVNDCLKMENEFKKNTFNYDYEIDSRWRHCPKCSKVFYGGYKCCDECREKIRETARKRKEKEMNRAERRRNKKAADKAEKFVTLRKYEVDKIVQEDRERAVDIAFILTVGLPIIELKDKFGFGKKRLTQFAEGVLNQYQCVMEDKVRLDEIREVIKEETGLTIALENDGIKVREEKKK